MSDTKTSPNKIDYNTLTLRALRGVVRDALAQVAETGLPGEHHFYISFDPSAKGVIMPNSLRKDHPTHMSIVLQHQFEDLRADDDSFSVVLLFQGKRQSLTIPYGAILDFTDPATSFRLQFSPTGEAKKQTAGKAPETAKQATTEKTDAKKERKARILQFPRKPGLRNKPKSDG